MRGAARVAGEPSPIFRANYLFRAVAIPAGSTRVVFAYESASLRYGAFASGTAGLILVGLIFYHARLGTSGRHASS